MNQKYDFSSDFDGLQFGLGDTVRDGVSGLTGIVAEFIVNLTSSRQVLIAPKGDGRTIPEGYNIDILNVTRLDDVARVNVTPFVYSATVDFVLGDKVRDKLTKLEGHVIARLYSSNGCIAYRIVSQGKDGPGTIELDQARLEFRKSTPMSTMVATPEGGKTMRANSIPASLKI